MSTFNLAKKLLPAKKAWKSFKTTFQSKLQKLNTSKAIKRTKNYCTRSLNSIRVLISCKLHALIRDSPSRSRHHCYHYHRHRSISSAIYVDELFPGHHSSSAQPAKAKEMVALSSSSFNKLKFEETINNNVAKEHQKITTTQNVMILEKKKGCETSTSAAATSTTTAADASKIHLLPQLRCVDERAEEFISKFRQETKLEREQSIIDFQEMLARSS